MAQQYDQVPPNLLQQNLIVPNEQDYCKKVDKVFYKAYKHFLTVNQVLSVYCIIKILGSAIMILINYLTNQNQDIKLVIWTAILIPISIMQLIYYKLMHVQAQKVEPFLKIAETLNHIQIVHINDFPGGIQPRRIEQYVNDQVYDIRNPQSDDTNNREITLLSLQIKYYCQKLKLHIQILARISFCLYQGLQVWGLYLYLQFQFDSGLLHKFLMVIIIIGIYQYIEFYVLILLGIVVLPFYGIFRIFKFLIYYFSLLKYRKLFKSKKFNAKQVEGEHQCKICMMSYVQQDQIVTLPCSGLHHFHNNCIKQWLKTSLTCPYCRETFGILQGSNLQRMVQP